MNTLDKFRLDGKRALITGGSRGLGLQMALALADAGADLVLVGRDAGQLDVAGAEIRARGRQAWLHRADVADPAACDAMCDWALGEVGGIDILFNNVGGRLANLSPQDTSVDQWLGFMNLNLTHVFLCTKRIGGDMARRGVAGRVINTASISGMIANRGIEGRHYEAAKAAVIHYTRAIGADWAPKGITVNAICPGMFMTEPNKVWAKKNPAMIQGMIDTVPMGRAGEPEEIGPLALFLASPASSYITGATFVIDGGYTIW